MTTLDHLYIARTHLATAITLMDADELEDARRECVAAIDAGEDERPPTLPFEDE